MHDLGVIIVSHDEASYLPACLTTLFAHADGIDVDVVVVENNEISDEACVMVQREFPNARAMRIANHGFAHANNCGLSTIDARYILFLNADTEIVAGSFRQLLRSLDERPNVGLVGVRQLTPDGEMFPTVRRFPSAVRALGEAFASERFPFKAAWLGERELDVRRYEEEIDCDWTSGSFMLARREALESAGVLDERFFLFSEETDLCYRIKKGGWEVRHVPWMTIVHHVGKRGINPRMEAQEGFARYQYARKHFSPLHREVYRGALILRHLVRTVVPGEKHRARRLASRQCLLTLIGAVPPPFGPPPNVAVRPRTESVASKTQDTNAKERSAGSSTARQAEL